MGITTSILTLTGLGVFFGAGLAVASKKFCVVTDLRLEKIVEKLPGANCGACGMPGCLGFAEALIEGKCTPEVCVVAKEQARQEIADILSLKQGYKAKIKTVAVAHCYGGNKRAKDKFIYSGVKDCLAASIVMSGHKACVYGCLGFASCVRACPFDAIRMSDEDLPVVDKDKCRACSKCVLICPRKLFELVLIKQNIYPVRKDTNSADFSNGVYVACSSLDLGKDTRSACSVGCIACRKCEQICPSDAIHLLDNLAVIDYNKCTSCGDCVKVCPTKTIQARA
ncbi:4Fe-4S dicluster domain-containing protein [bacterium]|nr:MAG: 4Fe-4S dicluster domain-containing protein [bacterium]